MADKVSTNLACPAAPKHSFSWELSSVDGLLRFCQSKLRPLLSRVACP